MNAYWLLDGLRDEVKRLQNKADSLYKAGWLYQFDNYPVPSESYCMGLYLRLNYSLPTGRKSVYIGSDRLAVNDALAGVARQREYVYLCKRIALIQKIIMDIDMELHLITCKLKSCTQEIMFDG